MRGVSAPKQGRQTMPYSALCRRSARSGKGEVGYFKMLNERGGINGRKVNLISLDDSSRRRNRSSRPGAGVRATRSR